MRYGLRVVVTNSASGALARQKQNIDISIEAVRTFVNHDVARGVCAFSTQAVLQLMAQYEKQKNLPDRGGGNTGVVSAIGIAPMTSSVSTKCSTTELSAHALGTG